MFTWIRSRLRFAGRIGWIDGRRGYPGEEQYVELPLHASIAQDAVAERWREDADVPLAAATVHPLADARRR